VKAAINLNKATSLFNSEKETLDVDTENQSAGSHKKKFRLTKVMPVGVLEIKTIRFNIH